MRATEFLRMDHREVEGLFTQLEQAVQHHVSEEEGTMFREAERLEERKRTLRESVVQRGIRGMKLAAKKIA